MDLAQSRTFPAPAHAQDAPGPAQASRWQRSPRGVVARALVSPMVEHGVVLAVPGGRPMNRGASAVTEPARAASWTA